MLFSELTGLTDACNLLLSESQEFDDDSFGLHSFELLEIDVAYPLVPQLNVGVDSLTPGIHCRFHLMRVEDEHLTFSPTTCDKSVTFFFNESSSIIEANLHALFHNLADRDKIFCYCWNMQDIVDVGLIALFAEWDITNILKGVNCVISFPHSRVVRAFVALRTNLHETSCDS